jgi:hypothetical protein
MWPIGLVHCNPSLLGYIMKVTSPVQGCAVSFYRSNLNVAFASLANALPPHDQVSAKLSLPEVKLIGRFFSCNHYVIFYMNSQTVLFFSTVNQAKVRNGGTSTRNMKRKNMTLQMISLLLYNVSKGKDQHTTDE